MGFPSAHSAGRNAPMAFAGKALVAGNQRTARGENGAPLECGLRSAECGVSNLRDQS